MAGGRAGPENGALLLCAAGLTICYAQNCGISVLRPLFSSGRRSWASVAALQLTETTTAAGNLPAGGLLARGALARALAAMDCGGAGNAFSLQWKFLTTIMLNYIALNLLLYHRTWAPSKDPDGFRPFRSRRWFRGRCPAAQTVFPTRACIYRSAVCAAGRPKPWPCSLPHISSAFQPKVRAGNTRAAAFCRLPVPTPDLAGFPAGRRPWPAWLAPRRVSGPIGSVGTPGCLPAMATPRSSSCSSGA